MSATSSFQGGHMTLLLLGRSREGTDLDLADHGAGGGAQYVHAGLAYLLGRHLPRAVLLGPGIHAAGIDRGDLDAVIPDFLEERLREARDGVFAGRVAAAAGQGHFARDGRDVDDVAV